MSSKGPEIFTTPESWEQSLAKIVRNLTDPPVPETMSELTTAEIIALSALRLNAVNTIRDWTDDYILMKRSLLRKGPEELVAIGRGFAAIAGEQAKNIGIGGRIKRWFGRGP